MSLSQTFTNNFNKIRDIAGRPVRIIYFSSTAGSVYDDDLALTISDSAFISGVVFPLNGTHGSTDSVLLEQGKLISSDKKLYLNGSVATTGSNLNIRIQFGSGLGESYAPIPIGGIVQEVSGDQIYKRFYIRRLTTGSLIGE